MPMIQDGHHGAEPSKSGDVSEPAKDVASRRDAPNPSVAVSWYSDVTLNRFSYVGPMAVRLLGFPASAWKEDGFWAMHLPADERETIQLRRKRHVADGHDFELNYHMIASDGSLVLRGLFLRNDGTPFASTTPASAASYGSWLSHELSQPIGAVLANIDAMRHLLRASPPRVDEALEALADVALSARDAASFLAVVRRSIRSAEAAAAIEPDRPA